jgi:hypothetical protein
MKLICVFALINNTVLIEVLCYGFFAGRYKEFKGQGNSTKSEKRTKAAASDVAKTNSRKVKHILDLFYWSTVALI